MECLSGHDQVPRWRPGRAGGPGHPRPTPPASTGGRTRRPGPGPAPRLAGRSRRWRWWWSGRRRDTSTKTGRPPLVSLFTILFSRGVGDRSLVWRVGVPPGRNCREDRWWSRWQRTAQRAPPAMSLTTVGPMVTTRSTTVRRFPTDGFPSLAHPTTGAPRPPQLPAAACVPSADPLLHRVVGQHRTLGESVTRAIGA